MSFASRPPRDPRLARLVGCLWCGRRKSGGGMERVLPTGGLQLVIDLEADGRATVVGPSTRFALVRSEEMRHTAGIAFLVGGGRPVLRVPAAELRDAVVDLAALTGPAAAESLRARLAQLADDPDRALDRLEAFALGRLAGGPPRGEAGAGAGLAPDHGPDPAVAAALRLLAAGTPVAETVEATGLARATLIRRFASEVGLSPKQWAGLARLKRASQALAEGRPRLADLALDCGFADQAHFTRAFTAYAGVPPSAWRPVSAAEANHARA